MTLRFLWALAADLRKNDLNRLREAGRIPITGVRANADAQLLVTVTPIFLD